MWFKQISFLSAQQETNCPDWKSLPTNWRSPIAIVRVLDWFSEGFATPVSPELPELVLPITLGVWPCKKKKKVLPAGVIRDIFDGMCLEIQNNEARNVGRKEKTKN